MTYYINVIDNEPKKYIRATKAAEILGVAPKTINRWIDSGHIKDAYKINPNISNSPFLVAQHEVDRLLTSRKAGEA